MASSPKCPSCVSAEREKGDQNGRDRMRLEGREEWARAEGKGRKEERRRKRTEQEREKGKRSKRTGSVLMTVLRRAKPCTSLSNRTTRALSGTRPASRYAEIPSPLYPSAGAVFKLARSGVRAVRNLQEESGRRLARRSRGTSSSLPPICFGFAFTQSAFDLLFQGKPHWYC